MSLVVVAGGVGAPGATTTAVALASAWPARRCLVVEADPDGGVLAARWGLGCEPGLVSAAASTRRELTTAELERHCQRVDSGLEVLCAPTTPEQTRSALGVAAGVLAERLAGLDAIAFVDVGRAWPTSVEVAPFVRAADAVLVVCRPRLDQLAQLVARHRAAYALAARCGVVLVGDHPYPPREVADLFGGEERDAIWATLPVDARTAEVYGGQASVWNWATRRAPLVRAASELAGDVAARLGLAAASGDGDGGDDRPHGGQFPRLARRSQVKEAKP
jgi:MinD-like ATPase involved in chromosome partitioning or flagellar assembly